MIGSAKTTRCSARTVTHPETSTIGKTNRKRKGQEGFDFFNPIFLPELPSSGEILLKIHTEPSLVHLGVAIRVFGEERQVADFEPHEDAKAQREQQPAPRARRPDGFLSQNELIDVGKSGE